MNVLEFHIVRFHIGCIVFVLPEDTVQPEVESDHDLPVSRAVCGNDIPCFDFLRKFIAFYIDIIV